MGAIANAMKSVIENSPNSGEVLPMTGNNSQKFKVFTMHAFTKECDHVVFQPALKWLKGYQPPSAYLRPW
jgi:hypothetical protein